jgi:hypothetical protein
MMFDKREQLWDFCIDLARETTEADLKEVVLEFGVWKGESINYVARKWKSAQIFGFDSFEGLEENWHGYELRKGHFTLNGVMPKVESNVMLIKGWVQLTLPDFMSTLSRNCSLSLVHIDLDTYTPTKFVLELLGPRLQKNTIIIFDEYFGYSSWRSHEFKAWKEFVNENNIEYEYLAYTDMQVAVIVK